MKSVKAPPGAKRLIESLRNLGYECSTAIADLIDNSLAADASEINVEIVARSGDIPAHIIIADNGKAMDQEKLFESMRFGAFQEYSEEDLGKYGLGLKTASLSQCTVLTVSSRPAKSRGGRASKTIARWDLKHVYKTDDWDLLTPASSELEDWERQALDQAASRSRGTIVLWCGLDEAHPLLCSGSSASRDRYLAQLIADVSDHLRMVFHRFMQGIIQDRPRVKLTVAGTELIPWDPFCTSEKTAQLDIVKQQVYVPGDQSGSKKVAVTMKPYILPREDEFSSREAWKEASGPSSWNHQQGFYFYRNHRLLQAGGWSNLRTIDEHMKLLRVAVNFPGSLDKAFALNITKMRAHVPAEIREETRNSISKWVKAARTRYDRGTNKQQAGASRSTAKAELQAASSRAPASPASIKLGGMNFSLSNAPSRTLSVTGNGNGLNVAIPQAHECAAMFDRMNGRKGDLTRLCLALVCLLEAVNQHRVRTADIPVQTVRRLLRKHL